MGSRPEWFEFEKDCARLLQSQGMRVVHQAASRSGDLGVGERAEVVRVGAWSKEQASLGALSMVQNWDGTSPWHNTKYSDEASGGQWVVYEADHAWAGEVRVIQEPSGA